MTDWSKEWKPLLAIAGVFIVVFFLPIGNARFENAITEALALARWYAREHVLLCLVPAFFIAGAMAVFVSQASVIKYLGSKANKILAYSVASVSGTILAVCSCTVLPLFAGIYRMGAGLGPATAFLYSGPAINVLAIILTARVLGIEIGIARAIGAIVFGIVIGIFMQFIFRKEELDSSVAQADIPDPEPVRPLWQNAVYFALLVAILVFANWARPDGDSGLWHVIYSAKWVITSVSAALLGIVLTAWFKMTWWKLLMVAVPTLLMGLLIPQQPMIAFSVAVIGLSIITSTQEGEMSEWFESSWTFAKQILPLLLYGVLIAGALLGRPEHEGLIPSGWIETAVGGNSIQANLFASIAGAFMYFATLTEVPILEGLIGNGMGKGPALALLLAGPAISLPNMLVIRSVIGTVKTLVYVGLVVVMATITGIIYGAIFG